MNRASCRLDWYADPEVIKAIENFSAATGKSILSIVAAIEDFARVMEEETLKLGLKKPLEDLYMELKRLEATLDGPNKYGPSYIMPRVSYRAVKPVAAKTKTSKKLFRKSKGLA